MWGVSRNPLKVISRKVAIREAEEVTMLNCNDAGFIPAEVVTRAASSNKSLFMQRAHQAGHTGRDATLAPFRMLYCAPHGSKLARSVKMNCQLCKLRDATFLEQQMGLLPVAGLHLHLTMSCLIYLAPIWYEARSKDAPGAKHMKLWGNEGRTHRGSVWIWRKQFFGGSADLQVSAEGRRKSSVNQVPNLWVQGGGSRKPGKRFIGSHCREAPRRMDQLGYLVLLIGLGIKEQLNR